MIPYVDNLTYSPTRNERHCLRESWSALADKLCLFLVWWYFYCWNELNAFWSAIPWLIPQDRAECELGRVGFPRKSKTRRNPANLLLSRTPIWIFSCLVSEHHAIREWRKTKSYQHFYAFVHASTLETLYKKHQICWLKREKTSYLLNGGVEGSELADYAGVVHRHAEAPWRLLVRCPNNWKR